MIIQIQDKDLISSDIIRNIPVCHFFLKHYYDKNSNAKEKLAMNTKAYIHKI